MSKRDGKYRRIQIEEILSAIQNNPIIVQDLLRYSQPIAFNDARDIPDIGWIQANFGSSSAVPLSFTQAQINDNGGNPFIDISAITGNYRIVSMTTDIAGYVQEMWGNDIDYTNKRIYGVVNSPQNFIITILNI